MLIFNMVLNLPNIINLIYLIPNRSYRGKFYVKLFMDHVSNANVSGEMEMNDEQSKHKGPGHPESSEVTGLTLFYKNIETIFPVNITIGAVALALNIVIVCFYMKQYRQFVPSLYLLISSSDCLMVIFYVVGVASLTHACSAEKEENFTRGMKWSMFLSQALMQIFQIISIFVTVELAVARTIKTLNPFYDIRMSCAIGAIVVYGTYWVAMAVYDVIYESGQPDTIESFLHYGMVGRYTVVGIFKDTVQEPHQQHKWNKYLQFALLFVIPYAMPVAISFVCAVLMINEMRKPTPSKESDIKQKNVAVTVLLLTVCFAMFNSATTAFEFVMWDGSVTSSLIKVRQVLWNTVPLLNATCNPIILISRSQELRTGFVEKFETLFKYTTRFTKTTSLIELEETTVRDTQKTLETSPRDGENT